jgi:hypothetical protein
VDEEMAEALLALALVFLIAAIVLVVALSVR